MKKQVGFKTKGMSRDASVSAFNSEFSFENINMRLNSTDGNSLLSWVNEKGTSEIFIYNENPDGSASSELLNILGMVIGTAVLNQYLILFTTVTSSGLSEDYIYRLHYNEDKTHLVGKYLYKGHLSFDSEHLIETLVSYESDLIQKVYWTDGKNQPRMINIMMDQVDFVSSTSVDSRFDFVRELQLKEIVHVQKQLGGNGVFAPGVIQYAFTYFDKYGSESCIFYTTPLYYISHKERGASAEDKISNSFKITVSGLDSNFEYLRIYSIHRTSINGVPFCKRVQDIELKTVSGTSLSSITYIDTGSNGDSIDPTELLYKGGESIVAQTMEQKDNTLFMGNIQQIRTYIESDEDGLKEEIQENIRQWVISDVRYISPLAISSNVINNQSYVYYNQLTSSAVSAQNSGGVITYDVKDYTVPCNGFKYNNYYRLGVQFQYKTGKWSEPIFIERKYDAEKYDELNPQNTDPQYADYANYDDPETEAPADWLQVNYPHFDLSAVPYLRLPVFKSALSRSIVNKIISKGYYKIRPVAVFPSPQDRNVVCQGVICPTLQTTKQYKDDSLHYQSSWFFRVPSDSQDSPVANGELPYTSRDITGSDVYNPTNIRRVEIWGNYDSENKFKCVRNFSTLHSPDIEFNDAVIISDFTNTCYKQVGSSLITCTLSDIDIQTETPTASSAGSGFIHKTFVQNGSKGIISGLFYDDCCVDSKDNGNKLISFKNQESSCKWVVNLWHKDGSLNNDINRSSDLGIQTAKLKKKVISNLRYGKTSLSPSQGINEFNYTPQIYSGTDISILKFNKLIYQGNINTVLIPDHADGNYFAFHGGGLTQQDVTTPFDSAGNWWKTFSIEENNAKAPGAYKYNNNAWTKNNDFSKDYIDLVLKKDLVRMKYMTTSHLVCPFIASSGISYENNKLPILDIVKKPGTLTKSTLFGGISSDALHENNWVPCGEPVYLRRDNDAQIEWSYGDTYFQRYDCLKTFPFERDDPNQVVEIGSFMLETYTNIEGRYDRNRGQINNLNMTPQNFNLINPVYSQINNFFSYKIMNDDFYKNVSYGNQITWSKTKESGADVDQWTNITLASALELDGDKGSITKIVRLNDQLICFQNTGISQILYNENTQISTSDGVPIEIANSGKVQGKRYLSNTIGCSNKWSVSVTPKGIYFIDNNDKSIYLLSDQLKNVSSDGGFTSWCRKYIPSSDNKLILQFNELSNQLQSLNNFITYYDKLNQELLFISSEKTLAYSERLQTFTSFYDYCNVSFFCNLLDTGIWINEFKEGGILKARLWKHHDGEYCQFFGVNKPYSMTLIGNPEPLIDKTFTNLEFRACVSGEGTTSLHYAPYLPFDALEVWNEYQRGVAALKNLYGHQSMIHHSSDGDSSLKRKFRIWRCDIPRDNASILDGRDAELGITRFKVNSLQRIRNPWAYIKLEKQAAEYNDALPKVEVHDTVLNYYI